MRWSQVLDVVDVHCGGENARVVTGGVGDVPGETMLDKRAHRTPDGGRDLRVVGEVIKLAAAGSGAGRLTAAAEEVGA